MPHPIAAALRTLGKSVVHVRDIGELGPKAPDPLIMQYSAANNFFVVSRDLSQAEEAWFKPTLLQAKAGYFLVRAAKTKGIEPRGWERSKLIIKAWDEVERYAAAKPLPFLALVKPNGFVTTYS